MDRTVCFPASGTEGQERQRLTDEGTFNRVSPMLPYSDEQSRWRAESGEAQEFWKVLVDSACEWHYWIDPKGRLLYVSPACERVSGYRAEEFQRSPSLIHEIIHPDDRTMVLDYLEQRAKSLGDEPVAMEFRIVDRDGNIRWISHLSRAVYSESGELLGRRGSNRDVTERKRYEALRKQRESRYKQVVEDQTDPICRFRPTGVLTFVNTAFCNYFQQTAGALIGKHFCSFIPDKHVQEVRSRIRAITQESPVFKCEYEITVPPGEYRWINWTFRGVFDAEGELLEIQSVARDTTDRKRAELALKESEERYANLIRSIPDGVVVYDPEGRATFVNDGFIQMYGWNRSELLGRSIGFVPDEEQQRTLAAWQETFKGEKVLLETKRRTKDGRLLEIQLRTSILRGQDGHVSESIVLHRDITERKKAEEALERARDELERRVDERTAELAEINRLLMNEIAERENAEKKLRESEARHRMLIEKAPLGIISCDTEGRVLQANSNLLTILGSPSPEETRAINLLKYPPLKEAGVSEEIRLCMKTEGIRVFECFYKSRWGKSAWLRLHMVPTRDNQRRVDGVQAIVEDITDSKQAQAALSESEERLRAVFDTAQDCIFLKDRDLVYTHVNPAFLRAVDLTEEDVIGKTDDEIFGSHEVSYIRDQEARVLGGQVMETTYNVPTRNASKTFHCIRVPMRGETGETIGICGIARDVTERKALERGCARTVARYRSTLMERTLEQIRLAAQSESIVLFLGESGSGKDYLSKYLHNHSHRAGGPYFAINCAALASSIAESELFGHEPGAFTGTRGRKRGLLEMAEGGTLLLNEIGELSLELQAKLLTFLDTQSFTRVGGEKTIQANARIVAATNRDLEREVANGKFREDLFYRLNVFTIGVPALRERKEDLPFLARDILETLSIKLGRQVPPVLDESALECLDRYQWPGNVRELRNVLERALILCRGNTVRAEDITLPKKKVTDVQNAKEIPVNVSVSRRCNMNEALEAAKRLMVVSALRRCRGNVSASARLLGVSRDAVRYHIKALDIDVERLEPTTNPSEPGSISRTLTS